MIFNEIDRRAAAWLRELMKAGLIPEGRVDERSIADIQSSDIIDAKQFHTFAGIGGWSEAIRLAGWPESLPVWTGSCPCQSYSIAGKKRGNDDERNLWPEFFRLIRECQPIVVFGEQVENAIGFGWLDGVFADLEGEGYACGATVLGAHSAGSDHIRQRLFWVAYSRELQSVAGHQSNEKRRRTNDAEQVRMGGEFGELADSTKPGAGQDERGIRGMLDGCGETGGIGNANRARLGQQCRAVSVSPKLAAAELRSDASGFWDRFDLIPCRDGKARRVESGSFPLVDGAPGRVGLLRGYGNAIVPAVAASFIQAAMECIARD